ncbi:MULTISPECIES: hypothetical protein [unclassified Acinetobacter]|uniref:hypothetical protein n=1 Tax=unclassified Acinetobacter TaxID=196816 RepID=UPI0025B8A263|nr:MULTISPECIES: hypothetical protein [unclassified Acinetobacter]
MNGFLKWLFIRKGSKVVTVDDDPITDIQNVALVAHGRIYTKEWNYKVAYSYDDVRLATRKEIKQGFKD